VCPDYSTKSDVSIGGSGIRSNFAITRTEIGEQLIIKALSDQLLKIKQFSIFKRLVINFKENINK